LGLWLAGGVEPAWVALEPELGLLSLLAGVWLMPLEVELSGETLAFELPAMLPAVFWDGGVVVVLLEADEPLVPIVLELLLDTVRLSFTLRLPAYCLAIFLAFLSSSFEETVPVSSTVESVTETVMLSLLSVESLFNAD
jgi:hypothetical protein